jgi:putative lipoic acid-binding regulatory protein
MEQQLARLKARLDECETWPCAYVHKFIVPATSAGEMAALLAGFAFTARQSSGGKYLSYTVTIQSASSDDVITVYRAALDIPGCMAL